MVRGCAAPWVSATVHARASASVLLTAWVPGLSTDDLLDTRSGTATAPWAPNWASQSSAAASRKVASSACRSAGAAPASARTAPAPWPAPPRAPGWAAPAPWLLLPKGVFSFCFSATVCDYYCPSWLRLPGPSTTTAPSGIWWSLGTTRDRPTAVQNPTTKSWPASPCGAARSRMRTTLQSTTGGRLVLPAESSGLRGACAVARANWTSLPGLDRLLTTPRCFRSQRSHVNPEFEHGGGGRLQSTQMSRPQSTPNSARRLEPQRSTATHNFYVHRHSDAQRK